MAEEFAVYVFLCCLSGGPFHEVAEVVGRQCHFVCKVFYVGNAEFAYFGTVYVIIKQRFKARHDSVIKRFPDVELTTVKSQAIIKQEFDIAYCQLS